MALYRVKGPDGKLHEFEGPAGMPNDLVNMLAGDFFQPDIAPAPVEKPKAETGFIPSVVRGGRGIYSLLGDVAPAMLGKVVGAEDYAKKQMQEAAAYQKETEEKYPSAVPSYTDIKSVGDLGTYIVESVGEAIPSILPSLFTGGASAVLGRTAVAAARTAAEKAVVANAAKGLGEAELKQAAMTAGVEAAKREALKYEAAGALAGSAAQNIPEVYQNLYDKGKDDIGAALAFGGFNAVLDAVTPINLLRKAKLSGIPQEQIIGAWYKRAGKGAIEGFATEGGTEMLQEMSSAAAEKFVDQNNTFFTPENFERFINAGLKGGFGGGVITGATNVAMGRAATPGTPEAAAGDQAAAVKAETEQLEKELGIAPTTPVTEPAAVAETPVPETTITPAEPVAQVPTVTTKLVKPLTEVQQIKKENELAAAKKTLADFEARGVRGTPIKYTQNLINRLERELGIAPAQGAANATEPVTPTVGEGADVSASGRSAVPATGGIETPERDGVVPAGPNVGEPITGEGRQPAPIELSDKAKEAIKLSIADGMDKRDTIDSLFEFEIYDDREGVADVPPLINKAQQKAAEDYYDSLSKPKTAAPTEVLKEEDLNAALGKTGNAIVDNMYEGMFKAYSEGKTKFARVDDPVLIAAKEDNKTFKDQKELQDYANQSGMKERATDIAQGLRVKRMLAAGKTPQQIQTQFPNLDLQKYLPKQEKPSGTQTSKTQQTKTQKQEATDTVPVEQRDMYEEEVEYHNETNPERKLPAYKDLMFDQKASYFSNIKKNSGEEHAQAVKDLANLIHGKAEEKKTERKTTPVKDTVNDQLQKGNGAPFLDSIRLTTKNAIRKSVAQRIYNAKLGTKIEVVNSLPEGRAAEYDPKTNTIRLTKQHQDEETLMHEYTHAATIDVIDKYENKQLNKLTPEQLKAVKHLEYLMDQSRKSLAEKYPDAYDNLHEFVTNAINNQKFQNDLGGLSIPISESIIPEDTSLWNNLLKAIAEILGVQVLSRGNMSVEALAAFNDIISAPPESGINRAPLPSKKTPEVKQATENKGPQPPETDAQIANEAIDEVQLKERGGAAVLKNLLTKQSAYKMVERFQNDRYILKVREDYARALGRIEVFGEKLNNVYTQITLSTGRAVDAFEKRMKFKTEAVHKAIEVYANKKGIDVNKAMARLHIILEAFHEPERRAVKFLKDVPLDNSNETAIKVADLIKSPELQAMFGKTEYSAAGFREEIMDKILTQPMFKIDNDVRKAYSEDLRSAMDKVIADENNFAKLNDKGKAYTPEQAAELFNKNSDLYSVIGERTPAQIASIERELYTKESQDVKDAIDAIRKAIKELQAETNELNKEANYWSRPVQNIVDFYGFENYVPFKGRIGKRSFDESFDLDSRKIGGEFQDIQGVMGGRTSEAENPLLQTLADGATAALRFGKKDVTLAIKNAVDKDNRILYGKVITRINFADRYKGTVENKDISGPDKVYHYNDDGSIDVIQLTNKQESEAVRRAYRESQPVIDLINRFTGGIGQMHTRYNPSFAPMNFVRDALTNAFTLGAEFGPEKAFQLLSSIASDVVSGGLQRSFIFSRLYSQGKFDEIKALAGGDKAYTALTPKERYYRDMSDYIEMGGRVSYLQGVASKGALDELIKDVGRSGFIRKKEQFDKFIDIYNDMFELSSRVATYRLMKDEVFHTNKDAGIVSEKALKDAQIQAVAYAKNLANFEQVGKWGKAAGAYFMFFRPAATGAVRAIEATAPAFQKFDEELYRKEAKERGNSDAAIDKAIKDRREQARHARAMAAGLVGMGVGIYLMALMMAGDDEQGRNKVLTDDPDRWTRVARIHIPGTDFIFQMPWGFGFGSFASAGAQIASVFAGGNSVTNAMSNILVTGLDSYLPIPVSKINPVNNPAAWALDSLAPSAARPFFEYVMNMDGLGRQIYNNRQTRYGDAYTGGDSIPELYKGAARMLFNATNGAVDWSPNTMYFFANNYVDGASKAFTGASNLGLSAFGMKEIDVKNDMPFLGSFIGSKSNVDAREYSKAEERIKTIEKRINSLRDKPEMFREYMQDHAEDYQLVQYYNNANNGALRNFRAIANQYRADPNLSIKDRKEKVEDMVKLQNMVKRNILDTFQAITGSSDIYR